MDRRTFISTGISTGVGFGVFSIVPNHVIAAAKKGKVAPSDKITLVHIGCGTQGLSELPALLQSPAIEIVGVADPNRESYDYIHWSEYGLRDEMRRLIGEPTWKEGIKGIPGGRNVMKEVVEIYYRKYRPAHKGSIVAVEDYRELLDSMKDVDAVKIMSPDHLHAYQALDCMKRGKHVIMHKPLGNKMTEAMKVVDMAESSPLSTYMLAYNSYRIGDLDLMMQWLDAGAIGTLKEVHNWSNRPVWPQYPTIPTDKPPVPEGFNWDLWLGPAEMRDYHPYYTHATFRGWYEFGAGALADMGYYSMLPVFDALKLDTAVSVRTRFSRVIGLHNHVPATVVNDYSYPLAAAYKFEVPYKDGSGKIIFEWQDGGMKPPAPEGYEGDDLPIEGMMFVGDKGAIVSGFHRQNPVLVSKQASAFQQIKSRKEEQTDETKNWLQIWMDRCKSGKKGFGSFENAKAVNETFNLGSVSLMCQGKKLAYDPKTRIVTNDADANRLLTRRTRKGYEME